MRGRLWNSTKNKQDSPVLEECTVHEEDIDYQQIFSIKVVKERDGTMCGSKSELSALVHMESARTN